MILGWTVSRVSNDASNYQTADLIVDHQPYWFFKYWPVKADVDVVGHKQLPVLDKIEKKVLKFNLFFPVEVLFKKYDLIICFHSQSAIIYLLFRWLLNINAPPFILIDIEGVARKQGTRFWFLLKRIISKASRLLYFASVQKEDYDRFLPEMYERSKFIHWGVDSSRYKTIDVPVEDYIISIGSHGKNFRDWDTLIKAMRLLEVEGRKTRLLIVGKSGFSETDTSLANIPGNIDFIEKQDLYKLNEMTCKAKFAVLALPERRHSYAQMTLLGCMALGKAVIVSKVFGVVDCVKDMETAVFHEPGNDDDLASKLRFLLDNPDKSRLIGMNAKKSIETDYQESIMAREIYESAEGVIKK
jgi:glycosyltransferase involved in cell wall biosynthesis